MAAPLSHNDDPIYQNPRLRGVSVDRFREYRFLNAQLKIESVRENYKS